MRPPATGCTNAPCGRDIAADACVHILVNKFFTLAINVLPVMNIWETAPILFENKLQGFSIPLPFSDWQVHYHYGIYKNLD